MALKLKVSPMSDPQSADAITQAIATVDPEAKVEVDIEAQTVTVHAKDPSMPVASETSIKQAIVATGYTIE